MRHLLVGIAMATLVMAKPELYREKEDFQYSRSSSDDGTKSGYYDAQRGNMGGNYERAHNMDTLAQHQMGGLVSQVEGELGDGHKTRTGSVFSSANSRGVFGSGHYDLSKLAGRNFQEGVSYDNSQYAASSSLNRAQSSHTAQSSSQNNARYSTSGHSLNSNYRGYDANNLQAAGNLYNANQFEQGVQAGHSSQYHSQSGYEGQDLYQQRINAEQLAAQNMDANTHHHRLISTVPVKIIVRPGQRIAIPIATQTHSGSQIASYYDHNAANTDAEVLSTVVNQQTIKPVNSAKHYESSYSYRKEWEKHDTKPEIIPLAIPTVAPIPDNSARYVDSYQLRGSQGTANRYEHNHANVNMASSHLQHQTDFNAQHHSSASTNSNAFSQSEGNSKYDSQSANLVGALDSKPKSYQSSYSYHKSWERQGDPYVIKPATNGVYATQTSDRLTDASDSQTAYSSYNYGSRKSQNQYSMNTNGMTDCEPCHIRVARSYADQGQEQQSENLEDLGQQTQNQWDNLADLGQQTQDTWTQADNFGQHTLNKEKLEDLGQQTQNQWDNLADLGQQTQNTWTQSDNFGQQTLNKEKLEDLGQQTQNQWDNLADLGQQTQDTWTQSDNFGQQTLNKEKLEDLGQQTQNQWGNFADLGQQTQDSWTQPGSFGQQTENKEKLEDLGQQTQNQWGNLADLGQQTQDTWTQSDNFGQQTVNKQKLEDLGQQTQNQWGNLADLGQQTQDTWTQSDNFGQQTLNKEKLEDLGQQTQNQWDNLGQTTFGQQAINKETVDTEQIQMDHGQQPQTNWNKQDSEQAKHLENFGQQTEDKWYPKHTEVFDQPQLMSTESSYSTHRGEQSVIEQTSYNQQSAQHSVEQNDHNQQSLGTWDLVHKHDQSTDVNREVLENSTTFHSHFEHGRSDNTGSLSNLWGKLDNLDDEYRQINKTSEDNLFAQSSTSNNFNNNWGQLDTYHTTSDKTQNNKDLATINQSQEKPTEKLPTVSDSQPIEDVKWTTPKAIEIYNLTTTTKKPQNTHVIRPTDIGRGDIGPEDFIDDSIQNGHSDEKDSSYNSQIETSTLLIHNVHEIEEITTESGKDNSQKLEKDNNDFGQNINFGQESQHFIDSMKDLESQNTYQQHMDGFSQQNQETDQQINWNVESQNVEQQFVKSFSEQSQVQEQSFDEQIINFGQQHDTTGYQSQQIKDTNPEDFIPEDFSESEVKERVMERREPSLELSYKPNVSNKNEPNIPKEQELKPEVQNKKAEQSAVTEKPGFWKSLGSKFSSAKSKVASWFGS